MLFPEDWSYCPPESFDADSEMAAEMLAREGDSALDLFEERDE